MNTHDSNTVIAQTVVSDKLPLRKWLYSWLLDPAIEGNYHKAIENFIALLIVGNLFALLLEHVPGIVEPNRQLFHWFDVISVVVFTVEYLARWYLAPEDSEFSKARLPRLKYVLSPFALIDLAAIADRKSTRLNSSH